MITHLGIFGGYIALFYCYILLGLPRQLSGKESACNVGAAGDMGSIPESGRYPGVGNGTHYSILAWKIPWTEETGRLQSMGSLRVGQD